VANGYSPVQCGSMIITITGGPGSGKTTAAKNLSKALGIPWYSMGDLRGKMAQERGMTIDQLNALGETEAFTDKDVDAYQKKLGESGEDCIVEGRLSWHFIPQSLKILLTINPAEGGRRIFQSRSEHHRPDEPIYSSPKEAERLAQQRIASDARRYKKYYQIDFLNQKNYDIVIDTTSLKPEETLASLLAAIKAQK